MKLFYFMLILALTLAHQEFEEDDDLKPSDQMETLQAKNLEDKLKEHEQMPWLQRLMKSYPMLEKVGYSIAQGGLEYFLIVAVVIYALNYSYGLRRNSTIS